MTLNDRTFLITDFGARSNCGELQTEKIQNAIDNCFKSGGGSIIVPEGTFLTGSIRLRSNCTLYLKSGAVLKGSRNPDDYFTYLNDNIEPLTPDEITDKPWKRTELDEVKDYDFMRKPGSRWNNGLIKAINADNIAIIGEENSFIDGSDCFDELGEENYRGPHCINLFNCTNVKLTGYSVKDSANWANALFYCSNVSVSGISVYAGHDGIHITRCENVKIENSRFYTGDDCIAGFADTNVFVTGCTLNSACSAMRFGGTNVFVNKCHIYAPCRYLFRGGLSLEEKRNGLKPELSEHRNNMLSAFTYYSDYSFDIPNRPENIVISDCVIDNADKLFHYNYSGSEIWQTNRPLSSISFENVTANGMSKPSILYGDKDEKIALNVKKCRVSMKNGCEEIEFLQAANFETISFESVEISNCKAETLVKTWTDGEVRLKDVKCGVEAEKLIVKTDEKFECTPI